MDADEADVGAHVPPADPARVAVPARRQRPDGDALADADVLGRVRPDSLDESCELVSLDARVQLEPEVAQEVVEVRAAESDRLRPDEHLAAPGLAGVRHVGDLHDASRRG